MSEAAAIARALAADYTAAWNSHDPHEVAARYTGNGQIIINRGEPYIGREAIATMAAGFFDEIPGLKLACDAVYSAGDHAVYCWTFTGTHAGSGREMRISGWEEWDIGSSGLITYSHGWYDDADYARQAGG